MQWTIGPQFYHVIADPKVGEQHTYTKYSKCNSFLSYNWLTQQWEPQSSYFEAMPWATCLLFHYVMTDPKVGEQHI